MTPDEAADMLDDIDSNGRGLTDWEADFIDSQLKKSDNGYAPSPKEAGIIRRIYDQRVKK